MKDRYLLDVNTLMALAWADHALHSRAVRWYQMRRDAGGRFFTCPLTENAFVRACSQSAVMTAGLSPRDGLSALRKIKAMNGFGFWPDNLSIADPDYIDEKKILSYKSINDAYLLGLAMFHGGKLATLDLRMVNLVGWTIDPKSILELIEE